MNEIASSRAPRAVTVVSEVIDRREEIFRVILIVVVASFALSFLVNILSTYLWEKTNTFWIVLTLFLFFLALGFCIFWALKSYAGDIQQTVHFELLLPFRANTQFDALIGNYYKILPEFKRLSDALLGTGDEVLSKIKEDWKNLIDKKIRSLQQKDVPHLLTMLHDVAEFFIFETLYKFTHKALTADANYQQFGWMRPIYKSKKFSFEHELLKLKNSNLFLNLLPAEVPKQLLFLDKFSFKRQAQIEQKKAGKGYLEFISKYGSFKFIISPFPILIHHGWRDSALISRYCGLLEEDVIAIKIPFALEINFSGLKIIRKEFREVYAPFIEDLVDYFQHSLDWQYCAQHDLERMVVELMGREV